MFEMKLFLSEDKTEFTLTLPSMTEPVKMSAGELDDFIRQLAWTRASMQPEHAPVDLTPETQISSVPAVRWQMTEDEFPGQTRLFLLHPGFGWLWIPLDRPAFDRLSESARLFLQARPSMQ